MNKSVTVGRWSCLCGYTPLLFSTETDLNLHHYWSDLLSSAFYSHWPAFRQSPLVYSWLTAGLQDDGPCTSHITEYGLTWLISALSSLLSGSSVRLCVTYRQESNTADLHICIFTTFDMRSDSRLKNTVRVQREHGFDLYILWLI